jgi:DNA replication protein
VKLAELLAKELQAAAAAQPISAAERENDLFTVFENEFARPLTPMELETITAWLDKDKYKDELILAALKEAVFSGKLHFRYIDRILLEWTRNRVQTADQAKEYAQRFRGGMR